MRDGRWTKPGSPETGRALVRAREICTLLGDSSELFAVLQGLEWYHLIRLDLGNARELGAQLLTLAGDIGEPTKLMVAHAGLGVIFLLSGEFAAARDHLDKASPRF